jgi:hypothetical protein
MSFCLAILTNGKASGVLTRWRQSPAGDYAAALAERRPEVWQRFAGKWATGATGQKPCTPVGIATVDFKGFFDPLYGVTEKCSFRSVSNRPNGRSGFRLKNAVPSMWPIFRRIVAIYQVGVQEAVSRERQA